MWRDDNTTCTSSSATWLSKPEYGSDMQRCYFGRNRYGSGGIRDVAELYHLPLSSCDGSDISVNSSPFTKCSAEWRIVSCSKEARFNITIEPNFKIQKYKIEKEVGIYKIFSVKILHTYILSIFFTLLTVLVAFLYCAIE